MLRKITSFGFKHNDGQFDPLPWRVVIDLRKMLKNPYRDKSLRYFTGTHPAVQAEIESTPHFDSLYAYILEQVSAPGVEEVWVGCTGGHHRSVFIAEKLAKDLGVPVVHRDIDKK